MKIYNTLTRQKQEFVPINKGEVKMYSCGPTVYDYFHIGNARPFIVFDTMRRYLEYQGYKVTFVQNFTDIDDKMIKRANEEGITVKELGERFIAEYFKDAQAIGIHKATIHPKATENIDAIINVVKKLVDNGYAYDVDGNVYFSTKKFDEYGKLSKQPLEDLEAGARIDVNEHKKDVMDFALWKKQKEGEPAWESPWGMGRPGWHIECSAMVNKYLGETIDIHSGGQDLIFPHHENEIAQSECANGKPFANYWMHNGYININNQKMSKSLGNFFTVRDILKKYDGEVVRFFMLSAHYRNPINFADTLMEQAKSAVERVYTCIDNLEFLLQNSEDRELTDSEKDFKLVYTPFHGCGHKLVPEALTRLGIKHLLCVPEQMVIDGNFPTVVSPNPENPEGFYLAIDLAKKNDVDFILGTDPDSDRVGIMVRNKQGEFEPVTGNQTGVLLLDYLIGAMKRAGKLPANAAALKTIVTTEMARAVAEANGLDCYDTFTGFKFMAEKMNELEGAGKNTVIFSYEESYGYMIGHYVRDKDAVTASLLLTEMAAWYYSQGMTLFDALNALFEKYGWYGEKTHNLVMPGLDGAEKMANLMKFLRETPPSEIGGVKVATYKDYSDGTARDAASGEVTKIALAGSNVLRFELADGTHIVVRPSGTEPKIKVYILTKGADAQERDANLAKYSAWVNTLA